MREYSSLHNHSHFSFLDAIPTPEELVLAAKDKGIKSIALTDHGVCHGIADFYLSGKKHGVRTLFGVEAYVIHSLTEWQELRRKTAEEKEVEAGDVELDEQQEKDVGRRRLLNKKGHLVLLAKNRTGLSNVFRLVHRAHKHGMYMKPRMDKKMLVELSDGIIATSACMGGVIAKKFWQTLSNEADWDDVVREASEFDAIFGRGNFFLELQFNEHPNQSLLNEALVKLSSETGIPLSVGGDAHYVGQDDWKIQELMYMMRANKSFATRGDDWNFPVRQLYVKSYDELLETAKRYAGNVPLAKIEEALEGTLVVDALVEQFEPDTKMRLPTLPYADTFKALGEQSIQGLRRIGLDKDDRYVQRLLYELGMIKEKGISNYFLIVKEITQKAREQMLIGPGRGSAGGSLVCYVNGITNIDPIEHRLMFERFINVDRVEMPDIDLDFQDIDGVKKLMIDKFGDDNVASISTYGTSQIKGLLKDLGRVYDIDHAEINSINAKIEKELQAIYAQGEAKSAVIIKLDDVYNLSKTFCKFLEQHSELEEPIKKMYGRVRHVSRHASGVVIGDELPAETAVFYSKGVLQTSFTDGVVNKNLSAMGLVKFDILGLATLGIIDKACKLIADRHGMTYQQALDLVDAKKMDLNDPKIMKTVFAEGNMTGIFQCTSRGMRRMIQNIKPDSFDDVAACGALYRPGPLGAGMDKLYAGNKEKAKRGELTFDHPILQEILGSEYGVFCYQEHVLELCRRVAGMSWKDTNNVRKYFLKRTKDMAKWREETGPILEKKFVEGSVAIGMSEEWSKDMWKSLEGWASYGFNSAHAKAYGMVTMQTAYLRTYYPLEFFSAVLTCGQSSELQSYVDDIRKQGFKVLPVDVNVSKSTHNIEGDGIRLALSSVANVGGSAVDKIIAGQPYVSLQDFIERSAVNKTAVESLIKAGALIGLEQNTNRLLKQFELFTSNPKLRAKKMRDEVASIFSSVAVDDLSTAELMEMEREVLGFNVLYSPFSINGRAEKVDVVVEGGLGMDYGDFVESEADVGIIPVVVKDIKERPQKNKQMFSFIKFADRTGAEFEAPCFSTIWRHVSQVIKKGEVYLAVFNKREDDPGSLIVGKPGFAHSKESSLSYFVRIDDLK